MCFFSDNMHTKIQPNLWAIFFSRQTVVIPRNILFNMNTAQYYRVDSSVRRNYSVVLHELIKHDLCVKIGSVMGYTALLLHWIKVACIFVLPRAWGNPNFACELSNMNQWLSRFFPCISCQLLLLCLFWYWVIAVNEAKLLCAFTTHQGTFFLLWIFQRF